MSLARGLILLVEDDPQLRDAIETLLHRANYDVISTGDGLRAVELADEHRPSVALVDLLVTGQSGFQVAIALKARFGDRVRVAVMSKNDSAAHQDYAAASDAERFLPKPFTAAALLDAVAALCPLPQATPTEVRRKVKIGA